MLSDDKIIDLFQKLGSIESDTKYCREKLDEHGREIQAIKETMSPFKNIKTIATVLFLGLGTLFGGLDFLKDKIGIFFGGQ